MKEPEVFVLADRTLNGVVVEIEDDQWGMEMPPRFAPPGSDHVPTLRDVVNHYAQEDARVPDILAGNEAVEPGSSGDLLGHNPYRAFTDLVDEACSAALAVDDLDRIVHTPVGDFTARAYLWQANTVRGLGAYDIGQAIGSDEELPDDLVRGLYEEVIAHGDDMRSMGLLPAAVPVPEEAPLLDRLLGLCGRDPALI
jgi:uncharacterized protein (TIGR03086 family)